MRLWIDSYRFNLRVLLSQLMSAHRLLATFFRNWKLEAPIVLPSSFKFQISLDGFGRDYSRTVEYDIAGGGKDEDLF